MPTAGLVGSCKGMMRSRAVGVQAARLEDAGWADGVLFVLKRSLEGAYHAFKFAERALIRASDVAHQG